MTDRDPTQPLAAELLAKLDASTLALLTQCADAAAGVGAEAYLVGGPVRDLLLDRRAEDIDVLVVGDAIRVAQVIARQHDAELSRFHVFGTAKVEFADGRRLDFASARSERYRDPGRLPNVKPGTLADDLARRDFAINAMAVRLGAASDAVLCDPFDGVGDLRRGVVRVLHERSFADDPTRVLRGLRFVLRFGYRFDVTTATALEAAVTGRFLDALTGDRLRRELAKLLEEQPAAGVATLDHHGLLVHLHPDLRNDPEQLAAAVELHRELDEAEPVWLVALAVAALELGPQDRWDLVRRLRLSALDRRALLDSGEPWRRAATALADATRVNIDVAEVLDRFAPGALIARAAGADAAAGGFAVLVQDYLRRARHLTARLEGKEIRELGCPEGPGIGQVLRALRAGRLDGSLASLEAERERARQLLAEAVGGPASPAN